MVHPADGVRIFLSGRPTVLELCPFNVLLNFPAGASASPFAALPEMTELGGPFHKP